MKAYKLKQLIPGSKVDPQYSGKWMVAVPSHLLKEGRDVIYQNNLLEIQKGSKALEYRVFHDRFGRAKNYTLAYYEWPWEVKGDNKESWQKKRQRQLDTESGQERLF